MEDASGPINVASEVLTAVNAEEASEATAGGDDGEADD